ncbi:heparinase II/III family protein [Paraflavitalea sp. CAU 1676]|uniref:heparinase II/III domain-containing protein n=1 Tax=Paraflavitalea sp. CAU 1676 TaxID=3032598 RepID=UPI0023DA40CB|nr:heparinase II/III family protein [Paraflavitalea sp. CAU 1676]MDF2190370.1 heparinase II/III family protein [Paraflavitalea sp. CAU 1676]
MMKKLFLLPVLLACLAAFSHEPRNLLQKKASLAQVKASLVPAAAWVKYPAYTDRKGWDMLTGPLKAALIKDGEAALNYNWKVVKATDYLAYERTGSRLAMETPFQDNNVALSNLVFAELAEGKGRFLDQIINGLWQTCDMSSWALSAHLTAQKNKRNLPDYREEIIDLTSGDLGSFLSWTWYFFRQEFDKVNPVIAARLKQEITNRILVPYMARSDYWWQALNYKPGMMVNNWNPWCNSNVLACFLLLEEDKDKLAAAVYRTMQSVDEFINYTHEDGACEEGPSYWGHAAGKLYDYLQLLSNASRGQLSIFQEPMIKSMGDYIARSYVGNGWVVNFADASAKGGGEPGVIYRYGKAVQSRDMQAFAAYLAAANKGSYTVNAVRDFFRTIENLTTYREVLSASPALPVNAFTWYPETQFCYMKNSNGFFFAAKGGFNNESHNHNDVGSFSLYVDTLPVIIDVGVGTYSKQTFSNDRYTIWTMQSNYHNLPMINGESQPFGAQYKASNVAFDANKNKFSLNIAGAYQQNAAVKSWMRYYTLQPQALVLEDVFELSAQKQANQVNFMTWARPDVSKAGSVVLIKNGTAIQLQYDASLFNATVETIPQTDVRLSRVWGNELYRLSLTAKKQSLKGRYRFVFTRNQIPNK